MPVSLSYEFVQRNRFSIFLTSGIQYEYGLKEKNRITEYDDGEKIEQLFEESKIKKGQAAFNVGFGTNYHINTKLDFYFQTSFSHYFYLSHYNMWSDSQVWPGLQAGFRFNL